MAFRCSTFDFLFFCKFDKLRLLYQSLIYCNLSSILVVVSTMIAEYRTPFCYSQESKSTFLNSYKNHFIEMVYIAYHNFVDRLQMPIDSLSGSSFLIPFFFKIMLLFYTLTWIRWTKLIIQTPGRQEGRLIRSGQNATVLQTPNKIASCNFLLLL